MFDRILTVLIALAFWETVKFVAKVTARVIVRWNEQVPGRHGFPPKECPPHLR